MNPLDPLDVAIMAAELVAVFRDGDQSKRRHSLACTAGLTHNATPTSARTRSR